MTDDPLERQSNQAHVGNDAMRPKLDDLIKGVLGETDETRLARSVLDYLDVAPAHAKGSTGTTSMSGSGRKGKLIFQAEPDEP